MINILEVRTVKTKNFKSYKKNHSTSQLNAHFNTNKKTRKKLID